MHDILQPYLNDIISTLIGLLVSAVLFLVTRFRLKMDKYIVEHTNAQQRVNLGVIASEAVAYAASVYKNAGGEEKLQQALNYVNEHMPFGLTLTEKELRGIVEKAYAEYQAQVNAQPQPVANTTTVSVQGQPDAQTVAQQVTEAIKKTTSGAVSS